MDGCQIILLVTSNTEQRAIFGIFRQIMAISYLLTFWTLNSNTYHSGVVLGFYSHIAFYIAYFQWEIG